MFNAKYSRSIRDGSIQCRQLQLSLCSVRRLRHTEPGQKRIQIDAFCHI
jgi:hypothetical protein